MSGHITRRLAPTVVIGLLCVVFGSSPNGSASYAQTPQSGETEQAATNYDLVFEKPPENVEGVPSVIGGTPASASDWPATFVFRSAGGSCTSTVVGARVLLTAAHCIRDGATGRIAVGGSSVTVACDHHPRYSEIYQLDVALCLASDDIPLADTVDYETVNDDPRLPASGSGITLLGFGCRQVGGGGPSGTLWQGQARVHGMAQDGYYIVTGGRGASAVCYGDSGGGSYFNTPVSRRLYSVNSRGNIESISYLTPTAHPSVMQFLVDWSDEKDVSICGVNSEGDRCKI